MASPTENLQKKAAAEAAVTQLEDGMIVGLGSGSTAELAVDAIGRRVRQGLRIIGIPTSEKTADQARRLNIPLSTLGEYQRVDVTIDGADEVEVGTLHLIKGGGGNQLREKIVAAASARMIAIVDASKVVEQLGQRHPVPVEVVKFGWEVTSRRLADLGLTPNLRKHADGSVFLTDDHNYILDCRSGPIADAGKLGSEIDGIVGVVEHGLFIGIAEQAVVGGADGVAVLTRAGG